MKGEMYVTLLVGMSERARVVLMGLLGTDDRNEQLIKLRDSEEIHRMTRRLECQPDDVFVRLLELVQIAFGTKSLPYFTHNHLQLLMERPTQAALAPMLDCHFEDVLGKLFEANAIQRTLMKVDKAYNIPSHLEALLRTVLTARNLAKIEQVNFSGINNWGSILIREAWLQPKASQALIIYGMQHNLRHTDPTRVLAALIENFRLQTVMLTLDKRQVLDWLALIYLRQRALRLVEHLREQSLKHAVQAAQLAPSIRVIRQLPVWLEVYERGAVGRAIPYIIRPTKPLSAFINREDCEIAKEEGRIDPEKCFSVTGEQNFVRNISQRQNTFKTKMEFVTFEIYCSLRGYSRPTYVMRCNSIPKRIYSHVKDVISKVSGTELSLVGNSIGERLLNTHVPIPDRFLNLLGQATEQMGATFAACLVLCNIQLPEIPDMPWREELNFQMPYKQYDIKADALFSHDIQAIAQEIEDEYRVHSKSIRVVTTIQ